MSLNKDMKILIVGLGLMGLTIIPIWQGIQVVRLGI